jgi:hypothetical protein
MQARVPSVSRSHVRPLLEVGLELPLGKSQSSRKDLLGISSAAFDESGSNRKDVSPSHQTQAGAVGRTPGKGSKPLVVLSEFVESFEVCQSLSKFVRSLSKVAEYHDTQCHPWGCFGEHRSSRDSRRTSWAGDLPELSDLPALPDLPDVLNLPGPPRPPGMSHCSRAGTCALCVRVTHVMLHISHAQMYSHVTPDPGRRAAPPAKIFKLTMN